MKIYSLFKYHIIILIQICILIHKVYLLDIIIKNNEESIRGFEEALKSNINFKEGINLYFPEPYYDLSKYDIFSIALNVEHTINCISTSENKTILDYGETNKYALSFFFLLETVQTVTFSNFIFINSVSPTYTVTAFIHNDAFHFVFNNCEFIDYRSQVFSILFSDVKCILNNKDFNQVEFNNCKFS